MTKSIIEQIQDDDPSYDPLTTALAESGVSLETWKAATDRVYFDGYYGPISPEDWREQDGREPSTVNEALGYIKTVLERVEDVYKYEYCYEIAMRAEEGEYPEDSFDFCEDCQGHRIDYLATAEAIKEALVSPWFKEIYGYGYPS